MALFQSTYGTASYVGIGATAPQITLDVRGSALIGDYGASGLYNTSAALHLRRSGVNTHLIFENIGSKTGSVAMGTNGMYYGTDGNCTHYFKTSCTNTDFVGTGTVRFQVGYDGVLYAQTNGTGSWGQWYLRGTSLWGDGITTYTGAYTTAGTLYQTIGDYCMFVNPHITSSFGSTAYARFGRAGGVSTGTWWECGTLAGGNWHIAREANDGLGCITGGTNGCWGINTSSPASFTLDINGSLRTTSTHSMNWGGRAASALENQSTFCRWAHYDIRWYDWNGVGDFFYLQYGVGGIGGVDTNYKWYIGGVSRCYNGDGSSALYGPNATWGAYLWVGAGTSRIVSGQAQCISTNGNLHLDAGTGQAMYLNGYNAGFANAGGGVNSYGTFTVTGAVIANAQVSQFNRMRPYSSTYGASYSVAAIEVREYNLENAVGAGDMSRAPRIGFHWAGVVASSIAMESSGRIGIWNNPGNAYEAFASGAHYISGALTATGDVIAYSSDMRLKENIEPITDALDKVKSLSAFTYNFNEIGQSHGLGKERTMGVSAQEVQKVAPEVVKPAPFDHDIGVESKTGQHYLTVQYEKLVPLLIAALKEEMAKREEIEARVAALEKLLFKE